MDAAAPYKDVFTAMLGREPTAIAPCAHGNNNRAFHISLEKQHYFAKCYFVSDADSRDRLENEWQFLQYAKAADVPGVPRPVARNKEAHIAFYSYLEGRVPQQIETAMVRAAGQLIVHLNQSPYRELATGLSDASESCFSAAAHLALTRRRLDRLNQAEALPAHKTALAQMLERMRQAFDFHGHALGEGYKQLGISEDQELPQPERCLSPSDFGFHNSLIAPDGRMQFVDFEYAGWDDPAKMLCDFFLHPGIPVDQAWVPLFWEELKQSGLPLSLVAKRAGLLYPLLGLRWCCIILNVFIPEWAARRVFADKNWDAGKAQAEQLRKAEHMFNLLQHSPFGAL